MSREELILAGILKSICEGEKTQEIIDLADEFELSIHCCGRTMTTDEFEAEVSEDDIITYTMHEDEGYIKVSTISEEWASQIVIDFEGEM